MKLRERSKERDGAPAASGNIGPTSAGHNFFTPVAFIPIRATAHLAVLASRNFRRASRGPSLLPSRDPLPGWKLTERHSVQIRPL
jgi:hypothetical protein